MKFLFNTQNFENWDQKLLLKTSWILYNLDCKYYYDRASSNNSHKNSGEYIIVYFISIEELGAVIQNNLKYPNFENWDKSYCWKLAGYTS